MKNLMSNFHSKANLAILFLIILNFLDGFLTYYGLTLGVIEEANPLLSSFEPFIILIIKMILSLSLTVLYISHFPKRNEKIWFLLFVAVNLLYIYILVLHLVWLVVYFL